MAQVAERDADEHEAKERLSRLNKKAMLANRAREQAAKKAAQNQKGQRTGGYDPYSRKATKVVQYWTTKKREDDKQAAVDELQAQQSVQVHLLCFLSLPYNALPFARPLHILHRGLIPTCALTRSAPHQVLVVLGHSVACTRLFVYLHQSTRHVAIAFVQFGAALQARMSAAEELAGLELRTCAGELSQAQMMTRRLLGPQYRFVRSTNVDRSGKQVISLEQYQDMARRQGFDNLGLTL